uniref:Uncharacterized protein n=1 Tax=Strix occidentalis caurina TaxID=311401 RepID=A0A8D0F526_STROC
PPGCGRGSGAAGSPAPAAGYGGHGAGRPRPGLPAPSYRGDAEVGPGGPGEREEASRGAVPPGPSVLGPG